MPRLTRHWHGGVPGLDVGDKLRPAAALKTLPVTYSVGGYETDPSRVYLTGDKAFARSFAAQWVDPARPDVRGDLYNVRPRGELLPDPDYPSGVAYSCESAVIVAVVERSIKYTKALEIIGAQHTTWDGGGPMYDARGYMQPSPQMLAFGITAVDLAVLGPVPDYQQAMAYASSLAARRAAGTAGPGR